VLEVRRQFREHPGIMDYTEKPEYWRVISICTRGPARLATPALLAILSPVIIGLASTTSRGAFGSCPSSTGQPLANTLSNSGGAGQRKKYIEDGNEGQGARRPTRPR
jgi:K(+)-stimulated pyrophosphate-energized sodium pump